MTLILSILFTVNPVNKFHIYKGAVEDKLSCAELRPYNTELHPTTEQDINYLTWKRDVEDAVPYNIKLKFRSTLFKGLQGSRGQSPLPLSADSGISFNVKNSA